MRYGFRTRLRDCTNALRARAISSIDRRARVLACRSVLASGRAVVWAHDASVWCSLFSYCVCCVLVPKFWSHIPFYSHVSAPVHLVILPGTFWATNIAKLLS
ncbi:unnamed protein product [Toxocara canis]|uniref:Transmembrane protein n=1 Tax=Toxocara canis TaxID=6265 RepID=A0A183UI09_TOXCA|nr:unnamed protein product [Toxocara canis]